MDIFFCLRLFFVVIWCINDLNGQSTSCGSQNNPVVHICTNDTLVAERTYYINAERIPKFQRSFCECVITGNTSNVDISFSYVDNIVPESLIFKIDKYDLKSEGETYTFVNQDIILSVLTNETYATEGACLIASTDASFSVVCTKSMKRSTVTTSPGSISSIAIGSASSIGTDKNTEKEINKDDVRIIIPVVGSIAAVVCLVIVLLLVIFYRRRCANRKRQPEITNSNVTKEEKGDDYYMTENPMYQRDDHPKSIDNSENDYHYVENVTQNKQTKHSKEKMYNEGNHYCYSTCLKRNPALEKERTKFVQSNANFSSNENTYDTTSATSANLFQGSNEYHHLGNVGKVAVVDTYNTIGNASRSTGGENRVEFSEYHVTNARS